MSGEGRRPDAGGRAPDVPAGTPSDGSDVPAGTPPRTPDVPAGTPPGSAAEPGLARALRALEASGPSYELKRHGRVGSLAEAAALRGIEPRDLVKTIVVRRGKGDYLFVLVPGDREFSWPKLRGVLGVSRLSMPSAAKALDVTGYERGTITPFGATHAWPVIADAAIAGRQISMGAGAHAAGVLLDADAALAALHARLADVSDPPDA